MASLRGENLKRNYAIWIVCLLLFIAAADTIPDPPAINPPGSHRSAISALWARGPLSLFDRECPLVSNAPQGVLPNRLSIRLRFDDSPAAIRPLPRVHHATDTSPPVIF